LRPYTRTSFHHQPEAQHPKSSAIHKNAGRLSHLWVRSRHQSIVRVMSALPPKADIAERQLDVRFAPKADIGLIR
jgi:hypothetical protein